MAFKTRASNIGVTWAADIIIVWCLGTILPSTEQGAEPKQAS